MSTYTTAALPGALYRAEQVRELDRIAIEEFGIPAETLMERAGIAAFDALREDKIDLYVHDAPTSWQLANSGKNDDMISLYRPLTEEQLAEVALFERVAFGGQDLAEAEADCELVEADAAGES